MLSPSPDVKRRTKRAQNQSPRWTGRRCWASSTGALPGVLKRQERGHQRGAQRKEWVGLNTERFRGGENLQVHMLKWKHIVPDGFIDGGAGIQAAKHGVP